MSMTREELIEFGHAARAPLWTNAPPQPQYANPSGMGGAEYGSEPDAQPSVAEPEFEDYDDIEASRGEVRRLGRELLAERQRYEALADMLSETLAGLCPNCLGRPIEKQCKVCAPKFCHFKDTEHFHQFGCPSCRKDRPQQLQMRIAAAKAEAGTATNRGARSKLLAKVEDLKKELAELKRKEAEISATRVSVQTQGKVAPDGLEVFSAFGSLFGSEDELKKAFGI